MPENLKFLKIPNILGSSGRREATSSPVGSVGDKPSLLNKRLQGGESTLLPGSEGSEGGETTLLPGSAGVMKVKGILLDISAT